MSGEVLALCERPMPEFCPEQMTEFTDLDSIHASVGMDFDPAAELKRLKDMEGRRVLGVDIGGGKLAYALFKVENGVLNLCGKVTAIDHLAKGGVGCLEELEKVVNLADAEELPVGTSAAGLLEGTVLEKSPNLKIFVKEFKAVYGADFQELFGANFASVDNDGVAGLISAALHAVGNDKNIKDIVYSISGGGKGGGILLGRGVKRLHDRAKMHEGKVIGTEVGHVAVAAALNEIADGDKIYRQTEPCGLFGDHVCIENLTASGAGIENLWEKRRGTKLSGIEIEEQYKRGDPLAAALYDKSAVLTAYVIEGMAEVVGVDLNASTTVVALHGGTYKFPGHVERVEQALAQYFGNTPNILVTHTFSSNSCLLGAATSALLNTA